jgi:hypothetical protein
MRVASLSSKRKWVRELAVRLPEVHWESMVPAHALPARHERLGGRPRIPKDVALKWSSDGDDQRTWHRHVLAPVVAMAPTGSISNGATCRSGRTAGRLRRRRPRPRRTGRPGHVTVVR